MVIMVHASQSWEQFKMRIRKFVGRGVVVSLVLLLRHGDTNPWQIDGALHPMEQFMNDMMDGLVDTVIMAKAGSMPPHQQL